MQLHTDIPVCRPDSEGIRFACCRPHCNLTGHTAPSGPAAPSASECTLSRCTLLAVTRQCTDGPCAPAVPMSICHPGNAHRGLAQACAVRQCPGIDLGDCLVGDHLGGSVGQAVAHSGARNWALLCLHCHLKVYHLSTPGTRSRLCATSKSTTCQHH